VYVGPRWVKEWIPPEREVVAVVNRLLRWVVSVLGPWGPVAVRREMDDD
jgi:hypothetical protein